MGQFSNFTSVTGSSPSAGDDLTIPVPTGKVWRLLSLRFALTTSATAANRRVKLRLSDASDNIVYEVPAASTQAASLTKAYTAAAGAQNVADSDGSLVLALPTEIVLGPGYKILTACVNLQAGDSFDQLALLVEEINA